MSQPNRNVLKACDTSCTSDAVLGAHGPAHLLPLGVMAVLQHVLDDVVAVLVAGQEACFLQDVSHDDSLHKMGSNAFSNSVVLV